MPTNDTEKKQPKLVVYSFDNALDWCEVHNGAMDEGSLGEELVDESVPYAKEDVLNQYLNLNKGEPVWVCRWLYDPEEKDPAIYPRKYLTSLYGYKHHLRGKTLCEILENAVFSMEVVCVPI